MSYIYEDGDLLAQKKFIYEEDLEDCDFIKSLYPSEFMEMQLQIEKICNELEYPGSMMFDVCPDKVRISKICKDICKEHNEFDEKIIQTMLVNEMLRRRIRYRKCKGFC